MKSSAILALETPCNIHGVLSYAKVYLCLFFIALIHMQYNLYAHPALLIVCMIYIAGRQHSLYILNHDAAHGSLFKTRAANRWVSTALSILPMFHHPEAWSFIQWQRIHRLHHAHLFTDKDPNYLSRQMAGHTEQRMSNSRLIRDCLLSIPQTIYAFFCSKKDYCPPHSTVFEKKKSNHFMTLFVSIKPDSDMAIEQMIKIIFYLFAAIFITQFKLWFALFIFWLIPMYTFYPMILTYFDLTEHHWSIPSQDITKITHSKKHGFIMKMIVSYLPRGLHREHHLYPRVRAALLPKLKHILHYLEQEDNHAR